MKLALRHKLMAVIAGSVAGLSVLIFAALAMLTNNEVDRQVRQDIERNGKLLGQMIEDESHRMRSQIQLLAFTSGPEVIASLSDDPAATETRHVYASDLRDQLKLDGLLITDSVGRYTAWSGSIRPEDASVAGVESALMGAEHTAITARAGKAYLLVVVPYMRQGFTQATISAYKEIDNVLAGRLKQVLGVDVAFLQGSRVFAASMETPKVLEAERLRPELLEVGHQLFYAQWTPLPNSDAGEVLGMITLRSHAEAQSVYGPFRVGLLLLFGVGVVAALAAGRRIAKGVSTPLEHVVAAAKQLRAGEWPETIPVTRTDELGLLQSSFNEMTRSMRESQERLLGLIDRDLLTGLLNHRKFRERLSQECPRCAEAGDALSLLLIDLDRFSKYNEGFGHGAGDGLLQSMASLIQDTVPGSAIVSRYGGDEFAVILPNVELPFAEQLAETLRAAFQKLSAKTGYTATFSVGCAAIGPTVIESEGLVLAAELALSRAKQLGRNTVCRFDSLQSDGESDPFRLSQLLTGDGSFVAIQALAAAVDAKDAYTKGHSQRVAEYASDLARETGMTEDMVELIHATGTLHDVGKIGVPDAILTKPGRLTDEERAVMETHPVLGEVIVKRVPQLASMLPGVRHHHERWDGRGYPDGLAGENIPLIARYLALADTFDAMTSDRPYRKGLDTEVALAEIERCAGTQFDPSLAPAFVRMMRKLHSTKRAA